MVFEAIHFEGDPQQSGHIVTTACMRGGTRHILRFAAERIVGNGSFGVVFQATCIETKETVAIKRVLQDKRFKNRELQIMRCVPYPLIAAILLACDVRSLPRPVLRLKYKPFFPLQATGPPKRSEAEAELLLIDGTQ